MTTKKAYFSIVLAAIVVLTGSSVSLAQTEEMTQAEKVDKLETEVLEIKTDLKALKLLVGKLEEANTKKNAAPKISILSCTCRYTIASGRGDHRHHYRNELTIQADSVEHAEKACQQRAEAAAERSIEDARQRASLQGLDFDLYNTYGGSPPSAYNGSLNLMVCAPFPEKIS